MTRKLTRSFSLGVVAPFFVILIVLTAQAWTLPLFVLPVKYAGVGGSEVVAVGDLNGDGKLDLVGTDCGSSCGNTDGLVRVRLGNGDGTFRAAASYDSGGLWPRSVAIADMNGDGKPDIVVTNFFNNPNNFNGTVGVLLGNGDGTFQPVVTYASGGNWALSVAVADLNGDGKPDVVVTNCASSGTICSSAVDGSVGVLLGNGDGTFQPVVTYDAAGSGRQTAVADVNNDGKLDLVVAKDNKAGGGSVGVLLGNGNGTFQPIVTVYSSGDFAFAIAVADVNGDGKSDLIVGGIMVSILLGNGDGTFKHLASIGSGGDFVSEIAIADVNADGKLDLAVANGFNGSKASVGVLLGNGDGTFKTVVDFYPGTDPGAGYRSVAAADIMGDGRPLLVAASQNIRVLLNNTAPNPSSMGVRTSGSPSFINQPVTFTATVGSFPNGVDGELVTFYDGTTAIGKGSIAGGVATFSSSSLTAKKHTLKVVYPGDANARPSTATVKQEVDKYPTTTTLSSSLNPSQFGQSVIFTATVTPSGPYALTGFVRFFDGTVGIGTATLNGGVAKLTKSTLAVGTHPITVQYLGDSFNAKSTSPVLNQVVQ